ncbi:twin-arginine translocase subunit TatC [Nakamurella sp.]|uniref:twin-arginine translocase subunit TatC n=1 Tax=Nakamurella sp. TaxID=1869182 RepID=UPI003B3B2EC1
MPLMEHLFELRRRMFVAAVGIVLGSVVGFVWYGQGIPALGVPSLGEILIAPYCAVPSPPRITFDGAGSCTLLATGPFSILEVRLKAAVLTGAVLSSPIWLGQLWGFVTPALHRRERRFALTFVAVGSTLFVAGSVLAYVVIREGLQVLLGFGGDTVGAALSPDSYFSFLIAMLLIFGVSFELPLLLVMLNLAGVVPAAALSRWRRYAYFAMILFAGLVVPGNDPVTMLALGVSLCVLYEVAAQVSRIHDRRAARRAVAQEREFALDGIAEPAPVLAASTTPVASPLPSPTPHPLPHPRTDPNG